MTVSGFVVRATCGARTNFDAPTFRARGNVHPIEIGVRDGYVSGHLIGASPGDSSRCLLVGHLSNAQDMAAIAGVDPELESSQILQAVFDAVGWKALDRAEGSFVVALVNNGHVVVATSKAPGPSIYWVHDQEREEFWVSTELMALPSALRRLRPFAEMSEEAFRNDPSVTVLTGVNRVIAGTAVELSPEHGAKIIEYYTALQSSFLNSEQEAHEHLRSSLRAAIECWPRTRSTCLISGGLDSSIVAVLAARHHRELDLVSVGTAEANEFVEARKVGALLDRPVREVVVSVDDYALMYPTVVLAMEHHLSTYLEYMLPLWVALRAIAPEQNVLTGYGSDVLFAGFAQQDMNVDDIQALTKWEYDSAYYANELSQAIWSSASARFVAPFFDSKVVDLGLSIAPALKHQNGIEKSVLRKAFENDLGQELAWRKKLGVHHSTGTEDWLSDAIGTERHTDEGRRKKDRVSYEILAMAFKDEMPASEIDMETAIDRCNRDS